MKKLFADTFYFLALLNEEDEAHALAVEASPDDPLHLVTTAWVLTEVGDALAAPSQRPNFLKLLKRLGTNPRVRIAPPSLGLFDRGVDL